MNYAILPKNKPYILYKYAETEEWDNCLKILKTPCTAMFTVSNLPDNITIKKIAWDFGYVKPVTITCRNTDLSNHVIQHKFKKLDTTLTIQASVFTTDRIYVASKVKNVKTAICKDYTKAKKDGNYIDPVEFTEEILKYYKTNTFTNLLASFITKIANHLSYKPLFINYSFKDEMIDDALLRMYDALLKKKFNPSLGYNPFSYFTKIAYHEFKNRIKKERKRKEFLHHYQSEVYSNAFENMHIYQTGKKNTSNDNNEEDESYTNFQIQYERKYETTPNEVEEQDEEIQE